jgi:DNA-binding MarR family transcriptional regulator
MSGTSAAPGVQNQLCFAFYSMSHAFNRAYRQLLDPLGLTYPQYVVLMVLWAKDNLTVKEIGDRLFLDSGTLTPLLKRIEGMELVRRVRDKEDERQVRISLTQKGRTLQEKAKDIPHELGCMLGLTAEEASAMAQQIAQLRGRLHDAAKEDVAS